MNTPRRILYTVTLFAISATGFAQSTATPPMDPQRAAIVQTYEAYVRKIAGEIEAYKFEVEKAKTRQLQYRAQNDNRSAQAMETTIRQYTNAQALKQAELSMYQQGLSGMKGARSTNPTIAAAQDAIVQFNMERSQLSMRQMQAQQANNQIEAQRLGQQVQQKQAQITAKQQEIRLMELQAKTGRY